jgi:hypothetical protein
MSKFQATEASSTFMFEPESVTARNPTKASEHNSLEEAAQFLRLTKGVILPGMDNDGLDGSQAIYPEHSPGAVFFTWRGFADGGTKKLVDVSEYEGVLDSRFLTEGFKWRMVRVRVWHKQSSGGFGLTTVYPDGADDDQITTNVHEVEFFGGDGDAGDGHAATATDSSDFHFAFTITSAGDLQCEYNDINASYSRSCYALFRVEASPPLK